METAIAASASAPSYESVERFAHLICYKFSARFGGHHNDLLSEVNSAFLDAQRIYNPAQGTFLTLFHRVAWRRLISFARKERVRKTASIVGDVPARQISDFSVDGLLAELSGDAAVVLRLVFDAPYEIAKTVSDKGGEGRNWRSTIREYLIDKGWNGQRVSQTFDEIRAAL